MPPLSIAQRGFGDFFLAWIIVMTFESIVENGSKDFLSMFRQMGLHRGVQIGILI